VRQHRRTTQRHNPASYYRKWRGQNVKPISSGQNATPRPAYQSRTSVPSLQRFLPFSWSTKKKNGYYCVLLGCDTVCSGSFLSKILHVSSHLRPITMVTRSKALTFFACSDAGIVGSNPTQDMFVCVCVYSVFVLSCVYTYVAALRRADQLSKESCPLCKNDYETEEEAKAQERAVEPLVNENELIFTSSDCIHLFLGKVCPTTRPHISTPWKFKQYVPQIRSCQLPG
jgi:hypothetical protein